MPFKVYLVNLGKSVSDGDKPKVAAALKVYFDAVVTEYDKTYAGSNPKLTDSSVTWVDSVPSLGASDLLCYFVSSGQSVLKHMSHSPTPKSGSQGMTSP